MKELQVAKNKTSSKRSNEEIKIKVPKSYWDAKDLNGEFNINKFYPHMDDKIVQRNNATDPLDLLQSIDNEKRHDYITVWDSNGTEVSTWPSNQIENMKERWDPVNHPKRDGEEEKK